MGDVGGLMRRSQFTVDAEAIQGNEGATVTFRALKVREIREYLADPVRRDRDVVEEHVLGWVGIVDDAGKPLPSPADDPEVLGELYMHEVQAMAALMYQGPDGPEAKN